MVRLVGLANLQGRGRRQVIRIRSRLVILEWLVVRDIIGDTGATNIRMSRATRNSARSRAGRETTLEPAPGNVLRVEQIANVFARHRDSSALSRTRVVRRISIVQHTPVQGHWVSWKTKGRRSRTVRLARNQIKRARSRRAISSTK